LLAAIAVDGSLRCTVIQGKFAAGGGELRAPLNQRVSGSSPERGTGQKRNRRSSLRRFLFAPTGLVDDRSVAKL
jgi:hypothetical protein